MNSEIYKKLATPSGIQELMNSDFFDRRRIDPKVIESYCQDRLRDIIDQLGDLSRITILLAKTQAERYREREKERLKNKEHRTEEHSYLHTKICVRSNGYGWTANWTRGGYRQLKNGKFVASHRRIKVKANGNYSPSIFQYAPEWAKHLGMDVEANYVRLRAIAETHRKARESIYAISKETARYFDLQPGCVDLNKERASVLTATEAVDRFKQRHGDLK